MVVCGSNGSSGNAVIKLESLGPTIKAEMHRGPVLARFGPFRSYPIVSMR